MKSFSSCKNSTGKLRILAADLKTNEPQPVHRAFRECRSSYRTQVIVRARFYILLFASVLRECPVRDVNHLLRGGGGLEETSGTGGATLR